MARSVAAPWNGVAGARCLGADGYVSEDEPDPLASGNCERPDKHLGGDPLARMLLSLHQPVRLSIQLAGSAETGGSLARAGVSRAITGR